MARYKSFVADGSIPNGRLYAGDLNGIQDFFPNLSDFTQVLDVGILRVGDTSLQLLKYGAGEFRMSGDLRIDGILRALGGMLAGAFTTAQRDAIAQARRPYSLIIFNTTTNQYEYNAGTEVSPNWLPVGGGALPGAHASSHLPGGSDALTFTSINLAGTRAAKPAAAAANNGLTYFETDWNALWRSNGSSWVRVAHFPRSVTVSQFGSLPDFQNADEVFLEADSGVRWHLRYNSGGGTHKWECVGGPGLYSKNDSLIAITQTSYLLSTPTVQIPRAGTYDVFMNASVGSRDSTPTLYNHGFITVAGPGVSASDANAAECTTDQSDTIAWTLARNTRVTFTGAGTVQVAFRGYNADRLDFFHREIRVAPVAIS